MLGLPVTVILVFVCTYTPLPRCREMQQHVASLQAELKAAQAAADLEATLSEFRAYLENGEAGAWCVAVLCGCTMYWLCVAAWRSCYVPI